MINYKKYPFLLIFLIPLQLLAQQKDMDYYIEQGLQNSPVLRNYQYQAQSTKIDSQLLRATFRPQVNSNNTGTYAPTVNGWGYDGALSNLHTFTSLIGVSQTVIGRNNINNQYLSIQLQNLGLQNQGKISAQDLRKSITQQYITTYGDLLQIDFNSEIFTLLKAEDIILKRLAEKGVYKQTDYLSFLVNLQQQESMISQLRIQYQNDFATLNYITGLNDTAYTVLPAPNISITQLPDLQQTIFYEQFKLDSLKIKVDDQQIDYSYKPKVDLFADGGYNSSFAVTPYKNFGVSAGVSVIVPIYDGKQRKMKHQKLSISEQNRSAQRDFFTTQYHQQLDQLAQQLSLTEQLIQQTAIRISYAEGLIKAQKQQLITGDVHIADYIIAISNYLNAKNIITQNTINKWQIINQINYWNQKM
ncbi:Outer membrane protein TolC [Chitinophaga sp. CF118]|uniref:TolC family protein n=1 Tax=Chitinophaga sp. CF118 TaxID=1884367 RepID=UPI0008DF0FA6|nr:TolC family protein [Chitinophaga sp. CF118]SFD11728.1 Outer membrane protein TolC [Chitinophaga sp. CF118]